MALLVFVSLAGLSFFIIKSVRSTLTEQIGDNFRTQADSLDDLETLYLVESVKELQALASSVAVRDAVRERNSSYSGSPEEITAGILALDDVWVTATEEDPLIATVTSRDQTTNQATHRLGEFLDIFPSHSEVFVTDRYGGTIGATGRLSDYYQADEGWWDAGWNGGNGGFFVSQPEFDESAQVTALLIAVPVTDDAGNVVGVLRSTLNVQDLFELLASVQFGSTGKAMLVTASGDVLFDPDGEASAPLPAQVLRQIEQRTGGYVTKDGRLLATGRTVGHGGTAGITADADDRVIEAVEQLGWTTIVSQSTDEAFASIDFIIRASAIAALVAVAIATAAAFLLARAITGRLSALRNAATAIGEGRQALLPAGRDEIGQLSESLQHMAQRLDIRTEEMRRLASILEATPDIVATADLDGQLLFLNQAGKTLLGLESDIESTTLTWDEFFPPWANELLTKVAMPGVERTGMWSGEAAVRDRTGLDIPISLVILLHRTDDGAPRFFSVIARDIRDRKHFESQLVYLASHDPLTDLPNRREFAEELRKEIARNKRFETKTALLFIDLDNFKAVNDTVGHRVGDELLIGLARELRRQLRETDIIGRMGGDEFAILLPQINEADLPALLDRLLGAVRVFRIPGADMPVGVTASIGVATLPEDADTPEEALARADLAMYRAKTTRDRYCFYSSEQDTDQVFASQRVWEERIREALANERFILYAQPVVSLRNGARSFELLLRLVEGDEVVLPQEFLGIAERSGLISSIDRWVVRRAIALLAERQALGDDVSFEVNLSGKAIGDEGLLAVMQEQLAATGARPEGLVLEITETAAIANIERAGRFIQSLKELGCRFAIDDFGVGFSSFYYLKHLPVDFLKIDGSFISNLARDDVDQHLVRAIVEVARGLGKKTIAEYVGDDATVDLLRSMGVDFGQGFHLGKPLPLAEAFARPSPTREAA
jgi:diguanylate cyclase (GGDEF)-like protein/PAS domain S-box-containing protein